jgi:hypothetical protein
MTVEELMKDPEIAEMVEDIEWMAWLLKGCSISFEEWEGLEAS